jgi:cobalt/nickel transport protein
LKYQNGLLILMVMVLSIAPLIFIHGEYEGADGQAEVAITELNADYEPWFNPLFEPPGEVESLLFAAQAAFGAGIIGYVIGLYQGRSKQRKQTHESSD